jgi:hypothetical protein
MAVLKLETVVQSLLVHDVVVVAGVERIGTRLADRATPAFLPPWLPASDFADQSTPPNYPTGTNSGGVRAGRPVGSRGSLLNRCLPGRAGATSRPRGAGVKRAPKPSTSTRRKVLSHMASRSFGQFGRWCRTARRLGTRTRPAM